MAKFKVGDKVRLIGDGWSDEHDAPLAGTVVEIALLDAQGDAVFHYNGEDWFVLTDEPDWNGELVEASNGETRVTSSTGGQKGSKIERYDLIPPEPLKLLAELYGKGAEKYDDNNWRKGYDWKLSFASLQRHTWDFWNGVDIDEETGVPNLINAAWHCFTLVQFMIDHPEFDSRKIRDEVAGRGKDADNQDK